MAPRFRAPSILATWRAFDSLSKLEIIHLATNVGHQRAITVGLCITVEDSSCDAILVMDADEEDSPQAIKEMLNIAGIGEDYRVVARRGKRSENLAFQFSYLLYKLSFRLLTGREMNFGNFCLLSRSYARRLIHVPDLWNNLPAAILRSRLPIKALSVDRAPRYAGKSKMNLTSLVVHGFSGISVFAETIFVRLLFRSRTLFFLSAFTLSSFLRYARVGDRSVIRTFYNSHPDNKPCPFFYPDALEQSSSNACYSHRQLQDLRRQPGDTSDKTCEN